MSLKRGRFWYARLYVTEQAEGKPVDGRTDLFSLGVILYELATGVRPFRGDTPISTITSVLREDPPSPHELKPGLPRYLGRIISRCLEKSPDRRYQTALDLRNDLDQLRSEIESGVLAKPDILESGIHEIRAPRSRGGFLIPILVLAVVSLAWFLIFMKQEPEPLKREPLPVSNSSDSVGQSAVAVVGFSNITDPSDKENLGPILVSLIASELSEGDASKWYHQRVSFTTVRHRRYHPPSILHADDCRKAGAGIMVTGSVSKLGTNYSLPEVTRILMEPICIRNGR